MKKSIIKIIACLFMASMLLPANAVSAEAASKNQKALKAYEKILSNPTYSWSSLSNENKTKDYKFACEDLNGDGVKELILYNPTASYGSGYVKILMYVNNKVKLVSTNSGFGWYKKRKIIQIDDAHTGSYWQERYKLTSNAKTREVSSYMATDMKEYAKTYKRKEGILYYTSYKIHGKEMTYRNYKKSEKKLLGGEKMITIKEHKNTSTNRKSYLK